MDNFTASDVVKGVAGPIASAIIAGIVAYFVSRRATDFQQRTAIDGMLNKTIELAMAYPIVESDRFCSAWPNVAAPDDDKIRYDQYCCYFFNTLEMIWDHCRGKDSKISKIVHV